MEKKEGRVAIGKVALVTIQVVNIIQDSKFSSSKHETEHRFYAIIEIGISYKQSIFIFMFWR